VKISRHRWPVAASHPLAAGDGVILVRVSTATRSVELRRQRTIPMNRAFLLAMTLLACGHVAAQDRTKRAADFQASLWAASCMACHGTDGKAEGTGLSLGARPADELYGILLAYKTGQRTGTIMQQHAKGYSDEELRRIAQHFAQVRR
jgi:sulfide dehydrogenase cytochrome subunit